VPRAFRQLDGGAERRRELAHRPQDAGRAAGPEVDDETGFQESRSKEQGAASKTTPERLRLAPSGRLPKTM
jgi:hypothetical protein